MEECKLLGGIFLGYLDEISLLPKLIIIIDSLAKKHRKKYGDNIKGLDKDMTLQLLSSFGILANSLLVPNTYVLCRL